jgi:hypothetical protein
MVERVVTLLFSLLLYPQCMSGKLLFFSYILSGVWMDATLFLASI